MSIHSLNGLDSDTQTAGFLVKVGNQAQFIIIEDQLDAVDPLGYRLMKITELSLKHYRGAESLDLQLNPNLNVL